VITAVIDSSALLYLSHLDLTMRLSLFFRVVFVPGLVEKEVCRKHRFRYRMKSLYDSGLFRKCRTANEWNRQLLLYEKGIHPGEADALAQAQEQEIPVFIGDEKSARQSAQRKGKVVFGTAAILAKLYVQGLIPAHPQELIVKLRRSKLKCRIPDDVVLEAMKRAYEPLL
jgi:predicted nucleic acid-binding protein